MLQLSIATVALELAVGALAAPVGPDEKMVAVVRQLAETGATIERAGELNTPQLDDESEEPLAGDALSLSDKLAATDGILRPPKNCRLIIIDPPDTGPNSMQTIPKLRRGASPKARR